MKNILPCVLVTLLLTMAPSSGRAHTNDNAYVAHLEKEIEELKKGELSWESLCHKLASAVYRQNELIKAVDLACRVRSTYTTTLTNEVSSPFFYTNATATATATDFGYTVDFRKENGPEIWNLAITFDLKFNIESIKETKTPLPCK